MSDVNIQTYIRNGKECYLDPYRKKLIYVTPEETVRQEVLLWLRNTLEVPFNTIVVEQHLSHYGISSKKRADIVIHEINDAGEIIPLAIIECKAPNIYLDKRAENQIIEYCDLIKADYAMLTNGNEKICYKYDHENDRYIILEYLPKYNDMLHNKYIEYDIGELPQRIPFKKIRSFLKKDFQSYEEDFYGDYISKLTPMKLAVPLFNLLECLLDTRVKMPVGNYGMFELIEDYGIRMMSYGNASGGVFYGPYRSFLVNINGNTEFYSISITTYCKSSNADIVKTCICVAHDDEKETHHALQLVVDDNVITSGNTVKFYHHGKIAIGNIGSGKINELRELVNKKCSHLIDGKKFYLGSLINDRLWRLDDLEVIKFVTNLISYAMIRDEYRELVKKNKK